MKAPKRPIERAEHLSAGPSISGPESHPPDALATRTIEHPGAADQPIEDERDTGVTAGMFPRSILISQSAKAACPSAMAPG